MKIITSVRQMQNVSLALKEKRRSIAFVPTMGYLHAGHLSLIRRAASLGDVVVVSIFVNPAQFGPADDFARYPRDLKRDTDLAKTAGCDILFVPATEKIYPPDFQTCVQVERVSRGLEGERRPGHFRGVATVVAKLFNIVQPDIAIFGQKDAQQAVVIKQMVRDLNLPVKIVVAPTVREKEGLAHSSRNVYLTPEERKQAPVLYQSLREAKKLVLQGERNVPKIQTQITEMIRSQSGAEIEYVALTDAPTLEPIQNLSGKVLISLAVRFGKTRLIDNIAVTIPK